MFCISTVSDDTFSFSVFQQISLSILLYYIKHYIIDLGQNKKDSLSYGNDYNSINSDGIALGTHPTICYMIRSMKPCWSE